MQDQDQAVYNIVLSLKIHLNLMNFCIVCGVNLKERSDHDTKSNLVTSLNHILSSACFLKNSGPDKIKEIQLFQDGNEVTNVSEMLQNEGEVDTFETLYSDDDSYEYCDELEKGKAMEEEEERTTKTPRELNLVRHYCDKCPAHFPSKDSLKWHENLCHDLREEFNCSICNANFSTLEVCIFSPIFL